MSAGRLIRIWSPVFLWTLVIFMASTDAGSSQHTSRIIGPLLRWLYPQVSETTVKAVQAVCRKGAHLSEYAVLGMLLWRAWRLHLGDGWRWSWREARGIVIACAIYAATDEFHQLFVASRYASVWDVLLDSAGAAAGLCVIWRAGKWLGRW